jgi:hypothetical protein
VGESGRRVEGVRPAVVNQGGVEARRWARAKEVGRGRGGAGEGGMVRASSGCFI